MYKDSRTHKEQLEKFNRKKPSGCGGWLLAAIVISIIIALTDKC